MAKRKKKKKNVQRPSKLWKAIKILLLLGIGYGAGWSFGYSSGRDDGRAQAANSSGSNTGAAPSATDNYGRSPGHPHYGHGHP